MNDPNGARRKIAALLHARGPMYGDAAAEALGLTLEQWWAAVNQCPWFTIDHAGRPGWALTDRGRAEALEGTE